MEQCSYFIQGFRVSAVRAGLKKEDATDLALIVSEGESVAAGVFTTNQVKAAPVILTQERVGNGKARAIVVNAGNANACTGNAGLDDARLIAALVAEELGVSRNDVLMASTGVIGRPLDTGLIKGAIPGLVESLSPQGIPLAARAIMTTDSFPKISRFEGRSGGRPYSIVGIAKGAGMIMPDMATMLAFVLTDIQIDANLLRCALFSSVERTFNRITVDGDMSTNDTVLVMANGMAGNNSLSETDFKDFKHGLENVTGELARMIVQDGEGATKLVNVEIKGAQSPADAVNAAKTVANSPLVKTAFFGHDPNWGRIMAALGRAGIEMEEERVDIWVDDVQIVAAGLGKGAEPEERASDIMAREAFTVTIDLNKGTCEDRVVTCDLTHEYISINAAYRT